MSTTPSNATQTPLALLPPIPPKMAVVAPKTIVCKTCNEETGLTPETIMDSAIDGHICCPICTHVIYSCLPERPVYTTTYGTGGHYGGDFD